MEKRHPQLRGIRDGQGTPPVLRSGFWFVSIVALVEVLFRLLPTPASRHLEFVRREPPHKVVLLGDSAAMHGLAPAVLRRVGIDSVNFAVPSGSGIFARRYASYVKWRPHLVVYAGVPVETLDTWALQREERELVPLFDLALAGRLTADSLFSRASAFYRRRQQVLPLIEARLSEAKVFEEPRGGQMKSHNDHGWQPIQRVGPVTASGLEKDARWKIGVWFPPDAAPGRLRSDALVDTLDRWSGAGTRRALVIMPVSRPLRTMLFQHIRRAELERSWLEVAQRSDAALLDCTAAVADDAFFDDDHLEATGARQFSAALSAWLSRLLQGGQGDAAGCRVLR